MSIQHAPISSPLRPVNSAGGGLRYQMLNKIVPVQNEQSLDVV